jgi:hypothetical protein
MAAIDRHFAERNRHYQGNPKRAGKELWGMERTTSKFSADNNCKDPAYRKQASIAATRPVVTVSLDRPKLAHWLNGPSSNCDDPRTGSSRPFLEVRQTTSLTGANGP